MADTPLHDWLRPRLQSLLDEAAEAGFPRDVAEAVLIDLVTSTEFNDPAPPLIDRAGQPP